MFTNKREIIQPEKLFHAEGFTHAVVSTGEKTVYISGQLPWDENFQIVGEGSLAEQSRKVYENIQHVLDEIGATWENVVKTTIYTTKPYENEIIANVKHEFLKGAASPAETMIGVNSLAAPGLLVEIEAIVVI